MPSMMTRLRPSGVFVVIAILFPLVSGVPDPGGLQSMRPGGPHLDFF
jgi:hypothetical protein